MYVPKCLYSLFHILHNFGRSHRARLISPLYCDARDETHAVCIVSRLDLETHCCKDSNFFVSVWCINILLAIVNPLFLKYRDTSTSVLLWRKKWFQPTWLEEWMYNLVNRVQVSCVWVGFLFLKIITLINGLPYHFVFK